MEILSFGIARFDIADIDPVTGLALAGTQESIGDIFKDSCDMTSSDPSSTEVFAEQGITPRAVFTVPGGDSLKLSLMSTAADSLVKVLGGTKTTLTGVDTWHKPSGAVLIEKYVEIETIDGTIIKMPRTSLVGKPNFQFRRQGILLVDVIMTPLEPKVGGLSSLSITNPA